MRYHNSLIYKCIIIRGWLSRENMYRLNDLRVKVWWAESGASGVAHTCRMCCDPIVEAGESMMTSPISALVHKQNIKNDSLNSLMQIIKEIKRKQELLDEY